jgi:hypothetical protein
MKYICLGYIEPGTFEGTTEDERHAVLDECFCCNELQITLRSLNIEVTIHFKCFDFFREFKSLLYFVRSVTLRFKHQA